MHVVLVVYVCSIRGGGEGLVAYLHLLAVYYVITPLRVLYLVYKHRAPEGRRPRGRGVCKPDIALAGV